MTVKDNILPAIKNTTASPKAIPPLLPILLTILGEAASTTKNYQALSASHSETPTEYILCGMIYKKIKSIGKRYGHYGHYGHPSAIVHYLLPIIAIQGSWGRLQWTGNILNMAILESPSYGQTMASMAASMASRLSVNRMFFYTAFSKGQKQVGQVGQVGQWSIVSTISCHLSRYKALIAGWSG